MMEYLRDQLDHLTLWELIGHFVPLIALFTWYGIMFWKRKQFFKDMRGEDGVWQFIEWSGVFWMTFAPPMVVAAMFGVEIFSALWAFMEIVFFINILGKSAKGLIEARYGIPQDTVRTENKIEITETKTEKKETPPDKDKVE